MSVIHTKSINQSFIPSFPRYHDFEVKMSWMTPWGQRVFKSWFCSKFNVFWTPVAPAFTGDAVFPPPVIQIGLCSTGRFHWLGKKGVQVCLSFWFFILFSGKEKKNLFGNVWALSSSFLPLFSFQEKHTHKWAFGIFSNMQRLSTGIKARNTHTHTASQGTQSLAKSLATPNIEDVSGALGCFARWKHCSVSFLD